MKIKLFLFFILLVVIQPITYAKKSYASSCRPATCDSCCPPLLQRCQDFCVCVSTAETGTIHDYTTSLGHITDEFNKHRDWLTDFFFNDAQRGNPAGLLAAMQLMTEQLVVNAMQQVQIIGAFFDAKHQLETQRLFQVMTARAHKDYQPSKNLCAFGSVTQSLAESSRKSDFVSTILANRSIDRSDRSVRVGQEHVASLHQLSRADGQRLHQGR